MSFEKKIESTEKLRQLLLQQLLLFKKVALMTLSGKKNDIKILIASACSAATALCKLARHQDYFFAEAMMLARSVIEKITNFCYLTVCSDGEYERFMLHPYYRMYHNFDRSKSSGKKSIEISYSGKEEIEKDPRVIKALRLFSKQDHRLSWSEKSIDKKVSFIGSRTDIKIEFFLLNTLVIYSDASEALHGSFYGCVEHLGVFEPNLDIDDREAVKLRILKKTALLFMQLSAMIHEVIKYMALEDDLENILKESDKLISLTVAETKLIFDQ